MTIGRTMRRLGLGAAAVALTLGSVGMTPAVAGQAQARATAPQPATPAALRMTVLFIIADDLAPGVGSYGFPVRTPNIDRLARQGVSLDLAYSQFPWCGPSRASFLTGMRPNTTRVMDLSTPFRAALPDIQTIPQYFRSNGYFSGRVGKIFHQGVPNDIGTSGPDDTVSWDAVVNPRGCDRDAEDGKLKVLMSGIPYGSAMAYLDDAGADTEQTDGKVATAAIQMIRAHKDELFFIGVDFYRSHVPEVAPRKYFDLYPLDTVKAMPQSAADIEQRQMIRAYYAATSFMDAQVGRALDALEEMGLADDTIVVFTSDHGFMLGEHGQWMKNILWEESDRVPLILRVPGMTSGGKRRTVELLDLYPTLTELAGLPHYARNEGASLAPLLRKPADR